MATRSHVLVVDDSTAIQAMLTDVLGEEGFIVTTVRTGEDALDVIERCMPELVLLDWLLPGADGLEVLRNLRERLAPGTPVIMITSCDRDEHLAEAFKGGVTDYIKKPFSHIVVRARVAAAMNAFRAQRELRRSGETAAAATRAKSEFLAGMSHEIRTPMTAILGFADILSRSVTLPEQQSAVDTIVRNGQYLLELIDDILDVSKIEAGKLDIEGVRCSTGRIVADVAALMRVRAEQKGLTLATEFAGPIPETVRSDPTRLRQILINLIGNAIKFTFTGEVRIVTRLERDGEQRPRLRFDISDTGIGMTPEQIGRLFRPFVQGELSTTRKFGGTGLGLTICKYLAEMLGGDIAVASEPGIGSTFSVTIDPGPLDNVPLLENLSEHSLAKQAPGGAEANLSLDCRVLLAEDGVDNQRLIVFMLQKAGADVTLADNGAVAVSQALAAREAGEPFDVILMDMRMPVMDGYEATHRLREAAYDGAIVALTAHAMSGDRQKCLEAGCDDYLGKPIDRGRLITTIATLVEKNRRPNPVDVEPSTIDWPSPEADGLVSAGATP